MFHLHHLPVEHKHRGVFLEPDAHQQILHRAGSAIDDVAAVAVVAAPAAANAATIVGQPSCCADARSQRFAARTLHALHLRQHLHIDELEVTHTSVATSLPNARCIHRQHIDEFALLQSEREGERRDDALAPSALYSVSAYLEFKCLLVVGIGQTVHQCFGLADGCQRAAILCRNGAMRAARTHQCLCACVERGERGKGVEFKYLSQQI